MAINMIDGAVKHGPKPAEQWTQEERFDALDQLGMYDYIPLSPQSMDHDEIRGSIEARHFWFWTVDSTMDAIATAWPK